MRVRRRARCRHLLHDEIDPLDHKNAQREAARIAAATAMTFDECAKAYIDAHEVGWKNSKHVAQWRSTLATYVTPVFGGLSIQSIDTALVMKVLDPLWQIKPETASRVLRARSAIDGLAGAAEMVTAQMSLAKGLEFRAVVVMACDEDVLPLDERAADAADEAELDDIYETERRLLYVALTRA